MNDDVAGIILGLSISERTEDVEYMDIDTEEEFTDEIKELTSPVVSEPLTPRPRVTSMLISDILSPTALGARLAMEPLMLMPPPLRRASVNSRRDSIQEVSTSAGAITKSAPPPHSSPVIVDSDEEMLPVDTQFSRYDGITFPMRSQGHSFQVHHHHYYANTESQPSHHTEPPNGIEITRRRLPSRYETHHQNIVSSYNPATQKNSQDAQLENIQLPLPWATDALPVDRLPYVLSSYLQLLLNALAGLALLYLGYAVIWLVRSDVNAKVEAQTAAAAATLDHLRQLYVRDCIDSVVVPATEQYCAELRKQLSQSPQNMGTTSSVLAETIGIVINSLVKPLGLKFFAVAFFLFSCNFMFGYFRAKTYYGWINEGVQSGT